MTAPLLGLILAGGGGTRMAPDSGGADKALISLAGRPLLAHVIERLQPQCAALALNAAGDPARFSGFALNVIHDDPETAGQGPLAGILAGLDFAALAGFDRIVTAPVDTPFLPPDYVTRLVAMKENRPGAQIVCARTHGQTHYVCGLFPVALRDGLRRALARGERRVSRWIDAQGMAPADFPTPDVAPDPFLNINTPEDLASAERSLSSP